MPGVVDYLCNAFTPDRRAVWEAAIAAAGIPLKVRGGDDRDGFAEPDAMVDRMDELGIDTLVLPACDVGRHGRESPLEYDHVASRWPEIESLAGRFPGRFAALAAVDPEQGMRGVRSARARLDDEWVVGLWVHTHSWDRPFDHRDYYPYYALCAEADVPFLMQAGTSGGLYPSECGHPIGIDRAALYFDDVRFVLSHTGWPWVDEAVAMALKFPNVYLGTAAYPPRHWAPAVVAFLRGPGRRKVLFGTNFPTVGHRHALAQLKELELPDDVERALVHDTAHAVFSRLTKGVEA